jgi:hypothetical protein
MVINLDSVLAIDLWASVLWLFDLVHQFAYDVAQIDLGHFYWTYLI